MLNAEKYINSVLCKGKQYLTSLLLSSALPTSLSSSSTGSSASAMNCKIEMANTAELLLLLPHNCLTPAAQRLLFSVGSLNLVCTPFVCAISVSQIQYKDVTMAIAAEAAAAADQIDCSSNPIIKKANSRNHTNSKKVALLSEIISVMKSDANGKGKHNVCSCLSSRMKAK